MTGLACGIDFGTTNSSIALAQDGKVEVLDLYPGAALPASLPSLIFLHRNGNEAAGTEATQQFLVAGVNLTACSRCALVQRDIDGERFSNCNQFDHGGGCVDARLVAEIKSELSDLQLGRTHSWARDFSFAQLVAIALRDLKGRAERHAGEPIHRAVIGHPVAFVGASGQDFENRQDRGRVSSHEGS